MESHRRDFSTAFESGKDGRQAVEGAVRYKKLIFESLGLKKKKHSWRELQEESGIAEIKILLLSKMLLHRFSEKANGALLILQYQIVKQIHLK